MVCFFNHLRLLHNSRIEMNIMTNITLPRETVPTAPDICPISGRAFWGNLSHPRLGYVATYGGPFDTYTIPEVCDDGELRSERYDHERGDWVEGGEPVGWFYSEQQPAQQEPVKLTEYELWKSDELMAINAEMGLPMNLLKPFVKVVLKLAAAKGGDV